MLILTDCMACCLHKITFPNQKLTYLFRFCLVLDPACNIQKQWEMNIRHWKNDRPKKRLPQLQFDHHKFHMECSGTEPRPQQWESDVLSEFWPYHFSLHFVNYNMNINSFRWNFLCDKPYLGNCTRSDWASCIMVILD